MCLYRMFRVLSIAMFGLLAAYAQSNQHPRIELSADANWRFTLGDPAGAEQPALADVSWRKVDLPHDWSIEGKIDKANPTGNDGGYLPTGVGWYRRTFAVPPAWRGKQVAVEFGGVYWDSTVYLNGKKLGTHPNGYSTFQFDLTPALNPSGLNVLAVRVDNSAERNSRWYTGSGIYRHVRMIFTEPVHVAHDGVFVSTPEASATAATVIIATDVVNQTTKENSVSLVTSLFDRAGTKVGVKESPLRIAASQQGHGSQTIQLSKPSLWSPASPALYRAVTEIRLKGKVVDRVETVFGVRTIAWSVEKGLLLNGASIKLAGGSVHNDNGPLGAAAFDRAEQRKAEILKGAGFNAVRTAHNQPSTAFLDACDRLGLLVLDEQFDVWTTSKRKYDYARFFPDWGERDLDAMVLRDRNHPSVILWGIGNEIPDVWTPQGAPLAAKLRARVKALDTSRPITQAFPGATYGPNPDAAIAQVDIAGYNYNLAENGPKDHDRVPNRIMMTTESFSADAFAQWKLVHERPYVVGEFVWTAMDYLGESGIGAYSFAPTAKSEQVTKMIAAIRPVFYTMGADGKNPMAPYQNGQPASVLSPGYPWHGSYCGDIDLSGERKPWSYYRDILWNGGDRVYTAVRLPAKEGETVVAVGWAVPPALASWDWTGNEGKELQVDVYAKAEVVRLFLNGALLGEKPVGSEQQFHASFSVPFAPGTLKTVSLRGGKVVAENTLVTSSKAVRLKIVADRSELRADGQDLSYLTVEAVDDQGHLQHASNDEIQVSVSGEGVLAGVGSGDTADPDPYMANHRKLFQGRALIVVRGSRQAGQVSVSAHARGLADGVAILQTTATIGHDALD